MFILKHLKEKLHCKKIFKQNAYYKRAKYEDRNVLEQIIFPYILAKYDPQTILDIGREDYQTFYNEFFEGRELWTLDYDPERKKFGAKNHITDGAQNVANHFEKNKFDFILMNGVFGWGLNEENDIENAISGIYHVLKPGGIFIIGWNDTKELRPVEFSDIKSIQKFSSLKFPPLKSTQFKCINGDHTYNFFVK